MVEIRAHENGTPARVARDRGAVFLKFAVEDVGFRGRSVEAVALRPVLVVHFVFRFDFWKR